MGNMTNAIRESATAIRLLVALCLGLSSLASAATVKAYAQPNVVKPNRTFAYVITIQDGDVQSLPELRLPLQIQQESAVPSTSKQLSITNGSQSMSLRLTWGLVASEPGEFVIPSQNIKVDGKMIATNEVKLTVGQGGDPKVADGDDPNMPILQIELGKKEIYQGEVVPIIGSLYIPRQTQIRRVGMIEIEKSDLAIARFPQQSDQSMEAINGVGYIVLHYRSTLSSLRAGEIKVGPASVELLVEMPVDDDPRAGANVFPPNFPRGFFGVMTEPRKLVVKSQEISVNVLPLPKEGKPANFSGAVGEFALSASATPTELTVGDPVSVELVLEGSGNFDALTTPVMTSESGWKSYPAKRYSIEGQLDQSQVPTLDRKIGYTQVFIPEAVHKELPPFEINFFSPHQKKYVTLRTAAIPLEMKPAEPTPASSVAGAGASADAAMPPPVVTPPQADITDILVTPPAKSHWLLPVGSLLIHSPTFWSAQVLPVGLLVLASILAVARNRRAARMAGRAGELRAAWAALEAHGGKDTEFLHQAAQFIYTAKAGSQVDEPELKAILERYESANFRGLPPTPVAADEQRKITSTLHRLFTQSLAKVTVLLTLALVMAGQLQAQEKAASPTTPDEIYQEALAQVAKGNFPRAQYYAESLTKKDPPQLSSEVFQLIGHARYRQEDLGRAALWYQRAQLFDPRSPELRQNLRHLQERLRFLTFDLQSPLSQLSLWLTPNEWILLAAAGFWLVLLSITWRIWAGRRVVTWAVLLSILGLLVAMPASVFAAIRPLGADRVRDISVVSFQDVRAYTAATITSGTVIDLPPGSQVRVLDNRGSWNYVEIPNQPANLRGWVEVGALTPLWIWDEALVP